MATRFDAFETIDLKDALLVVALPGAGAAAPIAAQYLIRRLELPLVGQFAMDETSSVAAIQNGIATSPVVVYGGEIKCNLDKPCPRIYLITSEIPLPPELFSDLAAKILEVAERGGAYMVLGLEAVVREEGDDTPDVFCAAADQNSLDALKRAEVAPAGRALLIGFPGEMLLQGRNRTLPVATLMVEASARHPDGRAAAALIQVLDRLIPEVKVDYEPLIKEAMDLEEQVRKAQDAARRQQVQQQRPHQGTFI